MRILVVDDDRALREEFAACFDDYGVAQAASGPQALEFLRRPHEIDVVVLDVNMPGMNGLYVLEKIKETDPALRVIIFTGYGSKDVAIDALRARADDYVEKVLDVAQIRQVVQKHLQARARERYGSDAEGKVRHVRDFLERNFHKKVTLEDAAAAVYLSPKYLSRLFKETVRRGFNEYKLALRMARAKELLLSSCDTVEQLSDRLGYQNPESFIRQFSKIVGRTPAAFRRHARKKPAKRKR
ncbi:MAG: response regulator [Deltaproteobacteria bacterium]